MAKMTPWFRCVEQPPTRPGWYDVKLSGHIRIRRYYWHGADWGVYDCVDDDHPSIGWFVLYGAYWRGLAQPSDGGG